MSTIYGTVTGVWPAFGVTNDTQTWGYFSSKETAYEAEEALIQNEAGETVLVSKYDSKRKVSFEAKIKIAGAPGDTGNGGIDASEGKLSIKDAYGNTINIIMGSVSVSETNTDFVSITGEGTYYPNVVIA